MPLTRITLAALSLFCFFSSCKKDDFPELGDKLLKRMVTQSGDSILYCTFQYNTENRLVAITDSNNNGNVWKTSILYDTEGNPVKFWTLWRNGGNSIFSEATDTLVYKNGKLTEKLSKLPFPNSFDGVRHVYTYDEKDRLIVDSIGYTNAAKEVYAYTSFTYDDSDNVVKIEEFNKWSGTMASISKITATYNSDKNFYSNIGSTLYFITGSYLMLCRHNKTQVVYEQNNITENYTYQYDKGLLKRMILSRSTGGRFGITTFDFYYQ